MSGRFSSRFLGLALGAALLASCGMMDDDSNECTPGKTEACACVGGGTSAQVCLDDGSWGGCTCACSTASDCASGEVCSSGRCKESAARASASGGDGASDTGATVPGGGGAGGGSTSSPPGVEQKDCQFDAGCDLDERCRDNYCTTMRACTMDFECESRACYTSAGYCFPKAP